MKDRYKVKFKKSNIKESHAMSVDEYIEIIQTLQKIRKIMNKRPVNAIDKVKIYEELKDINFMNLLFIEEHMFEGIREIDPQAYVDHSPSVLNLQITDAQGKVTHYKKNRSIQMK